MSLALNCIESSTLCGAAILGCAGAAAAALFTTISPVGGAVFGASYLLSSRIVTLICESINCCPDHPIAKVATFVLSTIGGIAAAAVITTAIGIPITFSTGVILTVATIATVFATFLALGGCLCCSAISTGVVLGASNSIP